MKKIILIAVLNTVGFTIISCEKENLNTANTKEMEIKKESRLLQFVDSTSIERIIPVEGTGDDLVPIKPPKS
ncbi:hypothetical protein [Flavobacterium columnare]|uniref:Lipoprotein n=1 Tax=Flavobacterium columnare TaxID=996 RepID=A0AAI8GA61_9FLAO|nr:hypothetical protein [Flavobacterium columnare]AMO19542.1 hypothetical protein UN65_03560 [Flavobacterium columnare]AUX17482.1 hypothetical protein AQ623_03665 [Flavobacterium columnare]QOG56520.1 hypothetical protein HUE29_03615 [Flavobacterium columnare]QOG59245.1 hypothetical protein HUE30_03620 [Flavobacterium columnare]QOG61965.1 hypothetical protein HUE31_03620 [Flavobacterium columnare]